MVGNMILDIINEIFNQLNRQDNHIYILAVYGFIALLVIVLRIVSRIRYSGALMALRRDARELNARDDVKKLRNHLLRKTVAAYMQVANKAVTRIPTAQLVERQVDSLHLAGWRYGSITALVEGFETGLLWVGLLLALVFADFAHVYGVVAVCLFLLMRINAAFFDFKATRLALSDELFIYIEREVGRFYASDSGGAVLRLKNELTEAQNKQTDALTAVLTQLTTALTENTNQTNKTITEATQDIHTKIAASVDTKLVNMNTILLETTQGWEKSLTEATTVQTAMNQSADAITKAGGKLQSAAELLATHLQGHSNALSEQLLQLVRAVESMREAASHTAQQAEYIKRNQTTLETAVAAYEAALQNYAQNVGDSLGAFINHHAQSAAQTVNDALRGNIEKIVQSNERKQ